MAADIFGHKGEPLKMSTIALEISKCEWQSGQRAILSPSWHQLVLLSMDNGSIATVIAAGHSKSMKDDMKRPGEQAPGAQERLP